MSVLGLFLVVTLFYVQIRVGGISISKHWLKNHHYDESLLQRYRSIRMRFKIVEGLSVSLKRNFDVDSDKLAQLDDSLKNAQKLADELKLDTIGSAVEQAQHLERDR